MKKIKKIASLTMLLSLIPLILGAIYYDKLPNELATHFDINGQANGFMHKNNALIVMPLIFILVALIAILLTIYAIKKTNYFNLKATIILLIIPVISILTTGAIIYYNLGFLMHTTEIAMIMVGIIFIILGNFLPTVSYQFEKQTHPFYRGSESDWNNTKRFLSKTFFLGGILMLLGLLINVHVAMITMLTVLGIVIFKAISMLFVK